MSSERIVELEQNIGELIAELNALRKIQPGDAGPQLHVCNADRSGVASRTVRRKGQTPGNPQHGAGLPLLHVVGGRLKRLACPSRIGSVRRAALEGSAGSSAPVWQRARLAVSLRVARRRGIHS